MPSYGEKQAPAGKVLLNKCKPVVGTRIMKSNNSTITPDLKQIDNGYGRFEVVLTECVFFYSSHIKLGRANVRNTTTSFNYGLYYS